MQKTIVLEHNGEKIVSKPFSFCHACIIDDAMNESREKNEQFTVATSRQWGFLAIKKMFEGTTLTDEVIDEEINYKDLMEACDKVVDLYFTAINSTTKNS
jgi:hypothetical protein